MIELIQLTDQILNKTCRHLTGVKPGSNPVFVVVSIIKVDQPTVVVHYFHQLILNYACTLRILAFYFDHQVY